MDSFLNQISNKLILLIIAAGVWASVLQNTSLFNSSKDVYVVGVCGIS